MRPVVSIIIPVYNAEKNLHLCLESVVSQKFSDLECILIDDGSKDGSASICNEFAQRDSRIRVIHKENGGVSSARNRGIDDASGEYIMFLDSDDQLTPDCLETLFAAESQTPDLTIFSFTKVRTESDCDVKKLKDSSVNNHTDVLSLALSLKADSYTSEAFCFPWNKVFKTSIIKDNDIRFPGDICLREDEIFIYRYLKYCNSLQINSKPLYNYIVGTTGLTYRKRKPIEDIALANHIVTASRDLNPEEHFLQIQYRRSILYLFSAFANSNDSIIRKSILVQMKDLRNQLTPMDVKDRKLFLIVKFCIAFKLSLSNFLLTVFGNFWASRQKYSLNI